MPKITMKETTAHADHGSMKAGETYDVSDELAEHLTRQGIAEAENKANHKDEQQQKPSAGSATPKG
jgi:hypothetical protein